MVEANYKEKIRLQKLIFAGKVEFDGEKFGTAELSLVYKIKQASQPDLSNLVDLIRNSWNRLIPELKEWESWMGETSSLPVLA